MDEGFFLYHYPHMNTPKIKPIWIVLGVIAIFAIWVGSSYNGLISQDETVDSKWAQVDTQLQRRFDLIPSLVATVKGAAGQEQKVFGELAAARAKYSGASGNVEGQVSAANEYQSALGRLLVIVENYPQLNSIQSFNNLMIQLEGTENRISVERKNYNDAVENMNKRVQRFPGNIVAAIFGFEQREYFQAVEGADKAPVVNFE